MFKDLEIIDVRSCVVTLVNFIIWSGIICWKSENFVFSCFGPKKTTFKTKQIEISLNKLGF